MAGPTRVQLSAHPRARRHIATAKGWGGIVGFAIVFWLSHRAHMSVAEASVHAVIGGMAISLLAWAGAVTVWREIAVAEVERARRMMAERARLAAEEAEAQARAARESRGATVAAQQ